MRKMSYPLLFMAILIIFFSSCATKNMYSQNDPPFKVISAVPAYDINSRATINVLFNRNIDCRMLDVLLISTIDDCSIPFTFFQYGSKNILIIPNKALLPFQDFVFIIKDTSSDIDGNMLQEGTIFTFRLGN